MTFHLSFPCLLVALEYVPPCANPPAPTNPVSPWKTDGDLEPWKEGSAVAINPL